MPISYKNKKKGVTAVEILIVLAVLGILFSIVLPQFSKIRENQVLKNGIEEILSSINKAKSQTLSSLNSLEYGVHFESGQVIIFKGTIFSALDPDNEDINITSPASISDVTLGGVSGSSGEFYFNRLSGNPSKTGTVTLSTSNYSKTITISAAGTASVN